MFSEKLFQIYELVRILMQTEQLRELLGEKKRRIRHIIAKPADNCTNKGGGAVPDCNIF